MRTIKFRGKRTDNGEWVYGDLIHGQGSKYGRMYILPQSHIYPKGCNNLDGWDVIPKTVGQFTGLFDKDGAEIYEHDIVELGTKGVVLYDEDRYFVNGGLVHTRVSNKHKVIGNIHDKTSDK